MRYMQKQMKRILALTLVIAALLPAAPALAESYKAVVMGGPLKVYAKAALSGSSVTLDAYTIVTVSATSGNVAKLKSGKYVGYASLSGLSALDSIAIPAITNRSTRIYKEPTAGSDSSTVAKGFRLNVLDYNSDYAVVENNGAVGYAITSHLTVDKSSGDGDSSTGGDVVMETYDATVVSSSLAVYKSASTSAKKLGTLSAGAVVTVYAQNNTWAYIGKKGNYGFCKLSGLERGASRDDDSDELENAVKVTVTASSVKVYKSASKSSKSLGTLKKGAQVNLIRTEGNWAYIELNGRYGYCSIDALTTKSSGDKDDGEIIDGRKPLGTATVIESSAKVYASMSTSAKYTTLKMAETLSFYGYDSKWVLVGRDGTFGFMLRSTLSADSHAELALEDSGAGVVQLEEALLNLGYLDTVPDSNYNTNTVTSVQRMQAVIGMTQSGKADLATLRVLYSGNTPASPLLSLTLSSGSKNANVSRLQRRLYSLGYLSRESSVDGDFGNNTASAVRLFQTAAGISATGIADPKTLKALYSTSAPKLASGSKPADDTSSGGGSGGGSSGNTTEIPAGLASTTSTYSPSYPNAKKLEYVIYVCQQQLGKKYVFGAAGPSTFDCSGLMMYAFGQIGITLRHSAYSEGYNDARPMISSRSSLKRGDMVFFDTISDGDLCDHVGIYLGKDYFLHAGSGAGKVLISSLGSGYYNRVFSWGRRVLET